LKIVHSILTVIFTASLSYAQDQGQLLAGPSTYIIEYNFNKSVNEDFIPVDDIASNIVWNQYDSHDSFAGKLTKQFDNEAGKVRSIYTWIALNIKYDREGLSTGKIDSRNAEEVWSRRLAVCEGYANLFQEMCTASGIESRIIKGYVKGFAGDDLRYPNHVWNSVKIEGKWKLLDVTWASVNSDPDAASGKGIHNDYTRKKLDYFFLVKPKRMILTHLPEDPYWQLQNNYIPMDIFLSGDERIRAELCKPVRTKTNFEEVITNYEQLDSLDQSISFLERMENNKNNKVKEYGLGIAYYYKAQKILKEANTKNTQELRRSRNLAALYYQKSLDQLTLLGKDDFGYEFSRDLLNNVVLKMEVL
jgi:exonuclease VII small subunit